VPVAQGLNKAGVKIKIVIEIGDDNEVISRAVTLGKFNTCHHWEV